MALRNIIKQTLSKQQNETLAAITYAAKSGDVETVRTLLRQGAEIDDSDYDGRTALAMVGSKLVN